MLEYLRNRLMGPDNLAIIVTTIDEMYEDAEILALDEIGITIAIRGGSVVVCLPWSAITEIQIEVED
ncbi:MAG: hypothetical protein IPG54_01800 [Sphingomonadales bacterium]|nr:hypothetical protein [Sphingomonadales bacterium]MBK9003583.1 hypothetical protein [Sphingomonadales bacterium]MBK9268740.1 hypothetical protein [Sphingomonadales bacterium]